MARLAIASAFGIVVGIVAGAALGSHAEGTEPSEDVIAAAAEAGVDPVDLLGAMNTTAIQDPHDYLYGVGELARPAPPVAPVRVSSTPDWPIGGALGQRLWCIEGIESHHGAAMWNPIPVGREHAQGFLGWLPSTATSVGVVIGNRASEWAGAAYMLSHGRGREFFGIAAGIC